MNEVIENYLNSICCGQTPPPGCNAVVNSTAAARSGNNIVLSWTGTGTVNYDVYVDGVFKVNLNALTYTVANGADNAMHTYNIVPHCATGIGVAKGGNYQFAKNCNCPEGYAADPASGDCVQMQSVPATVTNPGYCLAPSIATAYSQFESRIYAAPFDNNALELPTGTIGGNITNRLTEAPQWRTTNLSAVDGPMNRDSVWIDSNCDGTKDSLAAGVQTTVAFMYNNTGTARTVHVGVGADNHFVFKLNGVDIANSLAAAAGNATSNPFKIWHIIPVVLPVGISYFNIVATGDGSTSDAVAMVVYDNTATQIANVKTDSELNILFHSGALRGSSYDTATCPPGWSLDVSAGSGNYVCRRTVRTNCG